MLSKVNRFDKNLILPYFEKWESLRDRIERCYDQKDRQAVLLMKTAIGNYSELLEYGGKELNERSSKMDYVLHPLNGHERFEFVKAKIDSHYAYVQLDALYTEARKKAARLAISRK